jgi:hypothetical protein
VKTFFCLLFPDVRKSIALFDGYQDSPACPSFTSSVQLKKSVEHFCGMIQIVTSGFKD